MFFQLERAPTGHSKRIKSGHNVAQARRKTGSSDHAVWAPGLACGRVFGTEEDVEGSFSGSSASRDTSNDFSGSGKADNGHGGSVRGPFRRELSTSLWRCG